MKYLTFISYRHEALSRLHAESLEAAIKSYAKPIWQPPAPVFRDERVLRPGDNLPGSIRRALEGSSFLIYLASPGAATSWWVCDELRIWCDELGRADRLLIVHIAGRISLDDQNREIKWEETDALPTVLQPHIQSIPIWTDLLWAASSAQRDLSNIEYKRSINALVARLRGKSPADMNDQQVLVHRRNLLIRNAGMAAIVVSALIATAFGLLARTSQRLAEAKTQEAIEQREVAVTERIEADTRRKEANDQRVEADKQRSQAELTLARSDFSTALGLVSRDDAGRAMPHLARSLLLDPSRTASAMRLSALLLQRPRPRLLERLPPLQGSIKNLEFSPDGNLLAVTTRRSMMLWHVKEHRVLFRTSREDARFTHLTFSKDSRWLVATAGNDGGIGFGESKQAHGQIYLWDTTAPTQAPRVRRTDGMLWSARFNQSGDALVTSTALAVEAWQADLRGDALWRIDLKQLVERASNMSLSDNAYSDFAFVDGGLVIAYGITTGVVGRWDLKDRRFSAVQELPAAPGPMRLSNRGDRVLITWPNKDLILFSMRDERQGHAVVLKVEDLRPASELMTVNDLLTESKFAPHGLMIATSSADGMLSQWSLDGRLIEPTGSHRERATSMDVAPHGMLLASASRDGIVRLWNGLGLGQHSDDLVHANGVEIVRFSPSGQMLAAGTEAGELVLWDVTPARALPQVLSSGAQPSELLLSNDGQRAASISDAGALKLWDVATGRLALEWTSSGPINQTVMGPSGQVFLVRGQFFRDLDVQSAKSIAGWQDAGGQINQIAIDLSGKHLLTATDTGVISIWNAVDGAMKRRFQLRSPVSSAIFLPSGNVIVGSDTTLSIWSVDTGAMVSTAVSDVAERTRTLSVNGKWTHSPARIIDLAISSDEQHLVVTYGHKGTIVGTTKIRGKYVAEQVALWDLNTLKRLALFDAGRGDLTKVTLAPSKRWVGLGSSDGVVRVWSTTDGTASGGELKHYGSIRDIAFVDDESRLLVTDAAPRLSIWQGFSADDRPISLAMKSAAKQLVARPGLVITLDSQNTIDVRDTATGLQVIDPITWVADTSFLAASSSSESLAALDKGGQIAIWKFPMPATLLERCALVKLASTASGYRLDSSGGPVPSHVTSVDPPPLSNSCGSQGLVAANPIGEWLSARADKRAIGPGFAQTPSHLLAELMQSDAGSAALPQVATELPSDACARGVVAKGLRGTGLVSAIIGAYIEEKWAAKRETCVKRK